MKLLMPLVIAAFFVCQELPNQNIEPQNPQKLVPPAEYRNTPRELRVFLRQQHCQLPETKSDGDGRPLNVVPGHFARADQTDWAALCVVNDLAHVVILWGGKSRCSDEIHGGWPLKGLFSQEPGGGLFLMPVGPKKILAYRQLFGDNHRNELNHQGIEVGDEKASLIYYCDGKNWLELQGND